MWRKLLAISVLLLLLTGCITQFVAEQLVAAPNARDPVGQRMLRGRALFDQSYTVIVGAPAATARLRYWVAEPKEVEVAAVTDLGAAPPWPAPTGPSQRIELRFGPAPSGPGRGWYQVLRFSSPLAGTLGVHRQPRGTVLVLPGHSSALRKNPYLLPWVGVFADAGYRVVVLEGRGHGDSTGRLITYGVREREDLSQVIDDLQRRGILAGPLAVFGHSLGAAVAIQAAPIDPRIDAVVAVSPFASLEQEIRDFTQWKAPYLRWLLNDWVLDQSLRQAGQIARFDPADASPARAITGARQPILLLHGTADDIVPYHHSLQIQDARPANTDLVTFPGADHFSLLKTDLPHMRQIVLAWLDFNLPTPIPDSPPLLTANTTAPTPGS